MLPHHTKKNIETLNLLSRCLACHNHIKLKIRECDKFIKEKYCSEICEDNHKKGLYKCRTCKKFKGGMVCSKCKIGYYCSKECQKKDYEKHKLMCEVVDDKKDKFDYKLYVGKNEWISINKLDELDYITTPNFDIFIRYAKSKDNCLYLTESTIMMYYKLKGAYTNFIKNIFNKKIKLKTPIKLKDGKDITHAQAFPCVEGVIMDNNEIKATICSVNGIVEQTYIERRRNIKTNREVHFTLPFKGSFHNLNRNETEGACTLGIHISNITNTVPGKKYNLILQICKKHCKIDEDLRIIYKFDIILPLNTKSKTVIYEPSKK